MSKNKQKISLDKSTIIILIVLAVTIVAIIGIKVFQSIDFEKGFLDNNGIETTSEIIENPTEEITETTTQLTSDHLQSDDWKSAYKSKLSDIKNTLDDKEEYLEFGTSYYCLCDIDNNNIQELIIYTATNESNAQFDFYTYADNEIRYLGNYYAGSSSLEIGDNGELLCNYRHMGVQQIYQLTVEGDKIVGNTVYTGSDENGYINMGETLISYELYDLNILE